MLWGHRRCGKCGLLGYKRDMVNRNQVTPGNVEFGPHIRELWYHKACYRAMGFKRCACGKAWVVDNDKAIKAALLAAASAHDKELARYKHIATLADELLFNKMWGVLIDKGMTGSAQRLRDLQNAVEELHAKDKVST